MKLKYVLLFVLVLASCGPAHGCVESSFELAQQSRLPRWFMLARQRSEVTVKLTFYTSLYPRAADALFEVFDSGGRLAQVPADTGTHPRTNKKTNQYGGLDPDSYPHSLIARAKDTVEILEFSQSSVFEVMDDSDLMTEASQAIERGSCFRH